jgi:hypothetical protein
MSSHNVAGGWIHIDVNMDDLTLIEKELGKVKDKSTMVLRSAINEAAKELNKRLLKEDKQDYAYREKETLTAAHTGNIKKATTKKLYATITVKSKIGELYKFDTNPLEVAVPKGQPYNPPRWYRAKVEKTGRRTALALRKGAQGDQYKAFVVAFSNGGKGNEHITLAQRQPGTRMRSDPEKEAIKALYSPSIANMSKEMYEKYESANVKELLAEHIQKQIQRYLG